MITIERETLRELLKEAYEAGWYGSLELCDAEVERLEKKAEEKAKPCVSEILASHPKFDINYAIHLTPSLQSSHLSFKQVAALLTLTMHWQDVGDG